MRNAAAGLAGALLMVLLAGTAYQFVSSRRDLRDHPAPGRLIDLAATVYIWTAAAACPHGCL
jgi:hypothetical protein